MTQILALLIAGCLSQMVGAQENTPSSSPSTPEINSTHAPAAPTTKSGPFPSDTVQPIIKDRLMTEQQKREDVRLRRLKLEEALKSPSLSPFDRKRLERRRSELNAEELSIPQSKN